MKAVNLFVFICIANLFITNCHAFGTNGGVNCAVCTVVVALAEQLSVIHNDTVINSLDKLCGYLPSAVNGLCKDLVQVFGPELIQKLTKDDNPDTACRKLNFCRTDPGKLECLMYPKQKNFKYFNNIGHQKSNLDNVLRRGRSNFIVKMDQSHTLLDPDICKLPVIKKICDSIDRVFDSHDPGFDSDQDRFSIYPTLRGSSWRGKDCNDNKASHHPGTRAINSDVEEDSNCNGIKGRDPATGEAYEDMFCSKSQMRGVVALGDSVSAHFHLPREWFNTSEYSKAVFENLPFVLENEFDWPEMSSTTGFMNNTYTNINHGPMESIYNKLYNRNRCNHRDYQNIAVNGARSGSMADSIVKSLYRNNATDYPLIIFLALIGNDVCNGHSDTFAHMTTPAEMRNNTLRTLHYLNATLPKGSHVFLVGLADGRVLYNSLHKRIHPIGSLRNDVTYSNFYDYFNCLEISPCLGWMNSNETIRNLTTERANQLTAVLKDIGNKQAKSYQNFNLYFVENPMFAVIDSWEKSGGQTWELLEPVDGFHTNQLAQSLTAEAVWANLEAQYPDVIGPVNTNNNKIKEIFGDQGGYL